jgi:hypothetical protein
MVTTDSTIGAATDAMPASSSSSQSKSVGALRASTSLAAQLAELDEAKAAGALSDEEYADVKKKLLAAFVQSGSHRFSSPATLGPRAKSASALRKIESTNSLLFLAQHMDADTAQAVQQQAGGGDGTATPAPRFQLKDPFIGTRSLGKLVKGGSYLKVKGSTGEKRRECPTCGFKWLDRHRKDECPKCLFRLGGRFTESQANALVASGGQAPGVLDARLAKQRIDAAAEKERKAASALHKAEERHAAAEGKLASEEAALARMEGEAAMAREQEAALRQAVEQQEKSVADARMALAATPSPRKKTIFGRSSPSKLDGAAAVDAQLAFDEEQEKLQAARAQLGEATAKTAALAGTVDGLKVKAGTAERLGLEKERLDAAKALEVARAAVAAARASRKEAEAEAVGAGSGAGSGSGSARAVLSFVPAAGSGLVTVEDRRRYHEDLRRANAPQSPLKEGEKRRQCPTCLHRWLDRNGKDECPRCLCPMSSGWALLKAADALHAASGQQRTPGETSTIKFRPSSAMESSFGSCSKGGKHTFRFGRCNKCGLEEGLCGDQPTLLSATLGSARQTRSQVKFFPFVKSGAGAWH